VPTRRLPIASYQLPAIGMAKLSPKAEQSGNFGGQLEPFGHLEKFKVSLQNKEAPLCPCA